MTRPTAPGDTIDDLVVVGAGGHGRETLDIVEAINSVAPRWRFLGFIDDGPGVADRLGRRDACIISRTDEAHTIDAAYVIGIGDPATRAEIDGRLLAAGRRAVTLIHPLASVASDNRIADGVLIAAGARITTNVEIGRHAHLNVNAVVSHDATIGAHTSLSPGVLVNGGVTIGAGVFVGTGAVVIPGCIIGDGAVVGAGAVVVDDVAPGRKVVGVPARPT